ncbi:5-(carboxyamino)imidazole ribonucleotide synthase, partial [Enterococcus faecalis]
LPQATEKIGFPCVLKTIQGGYDGKGQVVLKCEEDFSQATKLLANTTCELEKWVPFTKELSIIVAGNKHGYQSFPVSENIHRKNILHESIVPARISENVQQKAAELAQHIAEELNLSGVLAIELFLTDSEELYVNELAPRPHNSGHYSIEACSFSQFDAHIRGISNWGIGLPQLLQPVVMVNLLGEHLEKSYQLCTSKPTWQVHYYGKAESKVGRKMGHVTITTPCLSETLKEIETVGIWNVT